MGHWESHVDSEDATCGKGVFIGSESAWSMGVVQHIVAEGEG